MFKVISDNSMPDTKITLRPLIGLMDGRSTCEVEYHVVQEVEKHRRLRNEAVMLEAQLIAESDTDAATAVGQAYVSAMIAVHAQQTVVSTLLDILGYIPEVPGKTEH